MGLIAHPAGGLFTEGGKQLLLADLHLAKISHFRKFGSALPKKAAGVDYQNLTQIIDYFSPREVLFLGDLFHSAYNAEFEMFNEWRENYPYLKFRLIKGNHDIIDEHHYKNLGIEFCSDYFIEHLYLTHHPTEKEGYFNICGHIHPGYVLRGDGQQRLKLRCFYWKKNQLILPAFGNFTGKFQIKPEQGERILITTGKAVYSIN